MDFSALNRRVVHFPDKLPESCQAGKRGRLTAAAIFDGFGPDWLDEARCKEWVLGMIHFDGPRCAYCGEPLVGLAAERLMANQQACCRQCRRKCFGSTATILGTCKIPYRVIVFIGICLRLGMRPGVIAAVADVSRPTVLRWERHLAGRDLG